MYGRILIPLDGSETAEAILPFVEKLAGPVDAEVTLVRIVEPLSAGEVLAAAGVVAPDILELRMLEAKQYLAKMEDRFVAKGIRVRAILRSGVPAPEILTEIGTRGADLVAMATHARSGLGRMLFGSVAEEVLRASPVPILMIRMTERTAIPPGGARS
jgi:nucleotide-binding universal stress UspA family protein